MRHPPPRPRRRGALRRLRCGSALAALALAGGAAPAVALEAVPAHASGQWIVAAVPGPAAEAVVRTSGAATADRVLGIHTAPAGRARRLAQRLAARGLLRHVEPNVRVVPQAAFTDPLASSGAQEWLPRVVPADLTPPADIPPIAIIETGFEPEHPEMAGVTLRRASPVPDHPTAEEKDAFILGVMHGTAVASVIGAPADGQGIQGMLPGAPVWVYGQSNRCSDVASAIRQAVDDGARVINASYGFYAGAACLAHHDATSYAFGAGALVVAAAGNERPTQPWHQPANDDHVLTVGALNAFDMPAGFSHQRLYTDLAAPGEGVLAAVPTWWDTADGTADGYERLDGTSFSAPIVSAAAAWVLAERPWLTPDQLAEVLRRSARDLGRPGWDPSTGFGALDLRAALAQPAPRHDPYEPNDDIRWVSGRAGFGADPPLLRTARTARVNARLDALKDPFDVYPVRVQAGRAVQITLVPSDIAADLYAFHPSARSAIGGGGAVIGRSRRRGLAMDRLTIANRTRRAGTIWVEVRAVRGLDLSGSYSLRLRRA